MPEVRHGETLTEKLSGWLKKTLTGRSNDQTNHNLDRPTKSPGYQVVEPGEKSKSGIS